MTFFITLLVMVVILIFAKLTLGRSNRDEELKNAIEHMNEPREEPENRPPKEEEPKECPHPETAHDEAMNENIVHFRVRGLYYRDEDAQAEARTLKKGDELQLLHEPRNRKDKFAVMICTKDNFLGYVPEYLSEKVCRNLDSVEKCEVTSSISVDDIPDVYCNIIFKEGSVFYWESYLMSSKTAEEYKEKYPELKTICDNNLENVPLRVEIWKKLHEENPDDSYIEYQYIYSLYLNRDYRSTLKLGTHFRERLNLKGWDRIDTFLGIAKEKVDRMDELEIREQYVALYQKSHDLLSDKKYEEALQGFLQCMDSPYQVQALPKNICKCYEKMKRTEEGVAFAQNALKRKWLTQSTRDALIKFIAKYSAS